MINIAGTLEGGLSMKKTKSMKWAVGIFVASLASLCLLLMSFAKYVTNSGDATDTARVAKWGVTVNTKDPKPSAFSDSYAKDDETATSITNSVVSTDKVVAPGTTKSYGDSAITLSGTPEVAVRIKHNTTVDLSNWAVGGSYYCPLVVTIGDNSYSGLDYASADAFEEALEAALELTAFDVPAGTDLSTNADVQNALKLNFSWAWPFETGSSAEDKAANDVKDTALGNAAASGNAATITITDSVTVTQID